METGVLLLYVVKQFKYQIISIDVNTSKIH